MLRSCFIWFVVLFFLSFSTPGSHFPLQLSPDIDVSHALKNIDKEDSEMARKTSPSLRPCLNTQRTEADLELSDDGYNDDRSLVDNENRMFMGKSSGIQLVHFAMDSRNGADGPYPKCIRKNLRRREEYWDVQAVRLFPTQNDNC